MTIKIPRKEGERKISGSRSLSKQKEGKNRLSPDGELEHVQKDLLSVTEGKGEEIEYNCILVFLIHVLLLLMTIAAVVGCNFKQIQSLLWCDIIHLKVHYISFYYYFFYDMNLAIISTICAFN